MSLSRLSILGCKILGRTSKSSPLITSLKQIPTGITVRIPYRHLSNPGNKSFIGRRALEDLHRKDGIPPKAYTLIYRTNFPNYFLAAQIFVVLSLGSFITVGIASLIESQTMTEEEKREAALRKRAEFKIAEQADKSGVREEINKLIGILPEDEQEDMPKPSLADMVERDLAVFMTFMFVLATLAGGIYKLIRTLPVRIYVGKKRHCVAVYYGSIMPGRLTYNDLVAGTVVKVDGKFAPSGWKECVYKDGSGNTLVLFEHFFRRMSDFNYLLGYVKDETYDVRETNEEGYKNIGSLAEKGSNERPRNTRNSKTDE